VAGVYGIESVTYRGPENAEVRTSTGRAITNVKGIALTGGVSVDVAWYEDPNHPFAPFNYLTDEKIVASWTHWFKERAVATPLPLVGGSTFESVPSSANEGRYFGVAWAVAGGGAGLFRAGTTYHLLGGPYNPMTFLDFVQGQIAIHDIEAPNEVKDAVAVVTSLIEAMRRGR